MYKSEKILNIKINPPKGTLPVPFLTSGCIYNCRKLYLYSRVWYIKKLYLLWGGEVYIEYGMKLIRLNKKGSVYIYCFLYGVPRAFERQCATRISIKKCCPLQEISARKLAFIFVNYISLLCTIAVRKNSHLFFELFSSNTVIRRSFLSFYGNIWVINLNLRATSLSKVESKIVL